MPDEGDIAQEKYEKFLEARLKAAPGCQRCIDCQKAFEEGNDV